MEDPFVQRCVKEVADLSKGIVGHELQAITLQGLEVIQGHPGHFLFKFIVPTLLPDVDGNWHVGAMATLIDSVGALAVYSSCQRYSVSADFCISYYSTAKIQEEVVIEAKVVGKRERLSSVVVEIRRKSNGDLIALAKQWMTITPSIIQASKL